MQIDPTQKEKEAQVFWLAFWAGFGRATVLCLVDIVGTSPVDLEGVVTGQGIFAVLSAILGYGAGTNAVREWRETPPSEQPIYYVIEQPIRHIHDSGHGSYQIATNRVLIDGDEY